jgi:glutamate-1-semialdehyde 2,1-aminomutase
MNTNQSLFDRAQITTPGGVNSPVRAFKSVGGTPLFIKKGNGAHIWDEDDNQFIDFCCSWGPLILGHNHPKVYEKIVNTLQNGLTN